MRALLRSSFALLVCLFALRAQADTLENAERAIARGRYEAAIKELAPLVHKSQPRALALLARIYTLRGQRELAQQSDRKVIDLYNRDAVDERDGKALWAVAEAAARLGSYREANGTFARAVERSPGELSIELAWADLFLQKHALKEAEKSILSVLARDPRNARALERKARIDLERGVDFAAVEALLARALAADPTLAAAHVTRAGIALRDEDLAAADRHLDAALALHPRELEALSVRAAVRFVADDRPGFERAVGAVLAENPRFSRLYSIVATYAEWEHRYAELVELSEAALRIDGDDALAHATRGINLLRTGREQEGLLALKQAWALDRYDEQVFNLLELYERVIEKEYDTFELPPFRLRMSKSERELLEPYAAPLLLHAHETLAARYRFEPSAPTHVELYASSEHFSIRATGLPRLGVQGICFGNVLIALSPRGGEFNWAQILWHELSHVFHVQRSKGRVPRWFTEGLAEYETELARPEWKREDDRPLYDALLHGALPPLAQLNHAFTHARKSEQLMVAYYASALAARYIAERFGFPAIVKMLELWGEGLSSEQVFARALGSELTAVDRDFRAALSARLRQRYAHDLRVDLSDYQELELWRKRSRAARADAADHAGLALSLALNGAADEAVARAEALLKEAPTQPLARFTLAHVALERGNLGAAKRELDALIASGSDGYQLRMLRARIALAAADPRAALPDLEQAIRIDPERTEAHSVGVQVADLLGDAALLERSLTRLVQLDQHARGSLARLLPLLAKRGAYPQLLAFAEAGIERDVHSFEVHLALAEGLLKVGRANEARSEAGRAVKLSRGADRNRAAALLRSVEAELRAGRKGEKSAPARARSAPKPRD
jgi:tetratricopeptide (TPR) repeat protein